MYKLNSVTLAGNLVRDPQAKQGTAGMVVSMFLAVGRSVKRGAEWVEENDFIPVVAFGRSAEACSKYLHKGAGVLVTGRVSGRSYEDKSGARRWDFRIVADRVQFGGKEGQGAAGGGRSEAFGWDDEISEDAPRQAAQGTTPQTPRVQSTATLGGTATAPRSARSNWAPATTPAQQGAATAPAQGVQQGAGGKVGEVDIPF